MALAWRIDKVYAWSTLRGRFQIRLSGEAHLAWLVICHCQERPDDMTKWLYMLISVLARISADTLISLRRCGLSVKASPTFR